MRLDELIYKRLTAYEPLTKLLTKYAGVPAIFNTEAPNDQQNAWERRSQYPRLITEVDMAVNEERSSVGVLNIVAHAETTSTVISQIERHIRECLKDLIVNAIDGGPYCFAWAGTDPFETGSNILGQLISFDIVAFCSQNTTDPDPVMALNRYIKEKFNNAYILGNDEMGDFREPDTKSPIFYTRLVSTKRRIESHTVTWMDARLAVHVLCPDASARLKYVQSLNNELALNGKITMLDGSPMRVQELTADNKADYLKQGQLNVTVNYGLLNYRPKETSIIGVKILGGF